MGFGEIYIFFFYFKFLNVFFYRKVNIRMVILRMFMFFSFILEKEDSFVDFNGLKKMVN